MLVVDSRIYEGMISYVKKSIDVEVCGYLLGKRVLNGIFQTKIVKDFIPIKNVHQTPLHFFTMDVNDQLAALKSANEKGLNIIGVFHSHPIAKAFPSKEDLKYMGEAYSYVIISFWDSYSQSRVLDKVAFNSFGMDKSRLKQERVLIF
ncbi:M67 family metallopeptidase [Helicobacter sp. 11S02629-2]|uniref:Mov34/MPN/PAD-1 family protein n=1 Tax=Helicobacter sp. 11S02629-2 TaxID=1476195 RepID=UPI000BA5C84B|nr:M67 family metallopeptidase [Helicobacter sp. 11S02629-2]PAF44343.1 hypothetical protein BKH40_05460 [Helicobacter sp. 11S02629-2]